MSLKVGMKKKWFLYQWATLSLQLLPGVNSWSLLLHISCDYLSAEARLSTPTHFWIFCLLPTQPTIRSTASTLFRNTFRNCQLLVPAFIDMQNSFPPPSTHMPSCQITKTPFLKVWICEVSLNWELTAKWDFKTIASLKQCYMARKTVFFDKTFKSWVYPW